MMIMNREPALYWDRLHETLSQEVYQGQLNEQIGHFYSSFLFLCHSTVLNLSFFLISLQRIHAMLIIFDVATDDVYQSDGNVIKKKIVAMEVMKTPAIVVSSAHLHLIITAFLSVIYRYVKLNECLIVSDSKECALYSF